MVVNLDNVRVLGECAFLLRMKHDVGLLGAGYDKRNALRHGCYIYVLVWTREGQKIRDGKCENIFV